VCTGGVIDIQDQVAPVDVVPEILEPLPEKRPDHA
jgi:hypothetical protein